jgi:hypothetical protein
MREIRNGSEEKLLYFMPFDIRYFKSVHVYPHFQYTSLNTAHCSAQGIVWNVPASLVDFSF